MKPRVLLSALAAVSPHVLLLALTNPGEARHLISVTLRRLDEVHGRGLLVKDVIRALRDQTGVRHDAVRLPVPFWDNGGTAVQELSVLAAATSLLKPQNVFEIGTFSGLATTTFVLNCPTGGKVFTLDLPLDGSAARTSLPSDVELIRQRNVGEWYIAHGVSDRVVQLYADSMEFDPRPYRESIDLGFIDGAHTAEYVENDTRKMAEMMRPEGLIFWHDYGGRGSFNGVTDYLEDLARSAPVYREPYTTLAWAFAGPLKHAWGSLSTGR